MTESTQRAVHVMMGDNYSTDCCWRWWCDIYGEPVGRAERIVTIRGHGSLVDGKKQAEYKQYVRQCIAANRPPELFTGPVLLSVTVWRTRPKSAARREFPTTKPDLSNYLKLIEDCLTGLVIRDDAQIVSLTIRKYYAKRDDAPMIRIWLADATGTEQGYR